MIAIEKNNPKVMRAWTFYDWANSVYSLVITSAIFPTYYGIITEPEAANKVMIFGLEPAAAFNFSLFISFVLVLILSPILSSIADTVGNKLKFLKMFCYIGACSCIGLYFFTGAENVVFALILNITASVGFWGSLVFYNSYMPEIASEDQQDSLSARGYITGYIGSVILLAFCLFLIQAIAPEGQKGIYTRLCFVLTGLWWISFAQYTFHVLPNRISDQKVEGHIIKNSFKNLINTAKELFSYPKLKIFLGSFFFYSLGMQTVFLTAALYGQVEIGLAQEKLIMVILLIQLEAILGAWLFSFTSRKIGNRNTLLIGIFIWALMCFAGYIISKKDPNVEYEFYAIAAGVGLVMGGIQALSRSTYSKLLPETDDHTIYFSFYDVFEKLALSFGLLIYGFFVQVTGEMKQSFLAMSVSFVISFIIMLFLKKKDLATAK